MTPSASTSTSPAESDSNVEAEPEANLNPKRARSERSKGKGKEMIILGDSSSSDETSVRVSSNFLPSSNPLTDQYYYRLLLPLCVLLVLAVIVTTLNPPPPSARIYPDQLQMLSRIHQMNQKGTNESYCLFLRFFKRERESKRRK